VYIAKADEIRKKWVIFYTYSNTLVILLVNCVCKTWKNEKKSKKIKFGKKLKTSEEILKN